MSENDRETEERSGPGAGASGTPPLRLSARGRRTTAQPISFLMQQAVTNPGLISLAAGLVDQETLPVAETREILDALLRDAGAGRRALQYGTTEGHARLRELAAAHIETLEGVPAREMSLDPGRVVITTGSQQLLFLVADVLLDPGDIVLLGAPEYFVFMGALGALGARAVGVPMDESGMVPEGLEATLEELERGGELERVKLVYCGSFFQNPSGVTLAAGRRPRILEIVRRWSRRGRIFLLEDAAYRELCYEGESPRSIRSWDERGDTVILTQTFSKSFSPGLKTGYSVLPPELLEPVLQQKGCHDFGSPNLNQHLLAAALETGLHERHAAALRVLYRDKLAVMIEALEEHLGPAGARWTRPRGGLYVWVVVPEGTDTRAQGELFARCLREGVLFVPGEFCFPGVSHVRSGDPLGAPGNTMRLTFANVEPARIREGVRRLAAAIGA